MTAANSPNTSLYGRLGEVGGIRTVVSDFYERILADPALAPVFDGRDMQTLRGHQVAMLSQATGGPAQYFGRDMAAAHAGLDITGEQFDLVVGHLVAALTHAGVAEDDIGAVGAALVPLKPDIVTA